MAVDISGGNSLSFAATIDTQQFLSDLNKVEQELNDFLTKSEASGNQANKSIVAQRDSIRQTIAAFKEAEQAGKGAFDGATKSSEMLKKSILQLQIQMQSYKNIVEKATDPAIISKYNGEITKLESSIKRLSNIGKQGFDALGKPLKEQLGTLEKLQRAASLYRQGILQATNEANIVKYNKRLEETNREIQRLSNAGKSGFDAMGNAIGTTNRLAGNLKATLISVAGALGFVGLIQSAVQLAKELFSVAKEAEGVELAFSRIGTEADLEKLRVQTRGTVSDLELMKQAVKASNFKIPMDVLGKGLAFAQQRAKDTGQEVDYLVNSFVDGLGRKSTRILDNLGISLIEIQKEVQKVGDFNVAIGNIIEREMAKSGDAVETLGEKTGKMAASWDNALKSVSGFFRKLLSPNSMDVNRVSELTDEIANALGVTMDKIDKLAKPQLEMIAIRLQAQRDALIKERDALAKEEVEAFKITGGRNEGVLLNIAQRKKGLDEELKATQNILDNILDQNDALAEKKRVMDGILSVAEMQEKVTALRDEAINIVPFNEAQVAERARLLKEADELQKQIDEILNKRQKESRQKREYDEVQAYRNMYERINEIEREYSRKSLDKDEQELQAVRDKFKKLAFDIEKYNKDPKNTLKIDVKVLDPIRDRAIADLIYKQETEALKKSLDEQKQLYADFENYKAGFGADKARERYGKDLGEFKTYLDSLKSQLDTLDLVAPEKRDANYDERRKEVEELYAQEKKVQLQNQDALLKSLETYEQKRNLIIEQYGEDREKLLIAGDLNAIEELDKRFKQAINNLDDEAAQKLEVFKKLFEGVDELSDRQARAVVTLAENKLKELVKEGKISRELQKEIEKLLGQTKADINDRLPQRLAELSGGIRNMAGAVAGVNEEFAKILMTVSDVIGAVVDVKDSLDAIKAAQGKDDILGQITGVAGVIGGVMAAINVAKGIADKMNADSKAEQQRVAEQQRYMMEQQMAQNDAIVAQLEKQLSLIQEIYGTERITEYRRSLQAITNEYDRIAEAVLKSKEDTTFGQSLFALTGVSKELDEIIAKYNQGLVTISNVFFSEAYEQYAAQNGALVDLKGLVDDLTDPNKKVGALAELEKLLNDGLLDEGTASAVENLLALEEQFKETMNAMRAEVTGFGLDGWIDELVQIFAKGGADSAQAFSDNFDEAIKKSLLQSFRRDYLEKQMQAIYEMFAEYAGPDSGGILDDTEIADLRDAYEKAIKAAQEGFKELEKIIGEDLAEEAETEQKGLAGAIRGITETQADLLSGQFNAMRIHVAEIVQLMRIQTGTDPQVAIYQQQAANIAEQTRIAMQSFNQLVRIEANTANTVTRLVDVVGRMDRQLAVQNMQTKHLKSLDDKTPRWENTLRANGWQTG